VCPLLVDCCDDISPFISFRHNNIVDSDMFITLIVSVLL